MTSSFNQRGIITIILILAGAVVIGAGVFFTYTFLKQNRSGSTSSLVSAVAKNSVEPIPVPSLYVATRNGVSYARYNTSIKSYNELDPFAETNNVLKMNTTKDALFLYMPDGVERRRHDGTLEAIWQRSSSPTFVAPADATIRDGSVKYDELQTAVYDNGKIYVAANKSLIILDERLKELGSVTPLGQDEFYKYKAIDDILVNGSTVFLVDDIASPLFVFSVDVTNPTQPRLLRTIGVGGVYGTVSNQWFNHQTNEWCFQQSTSSGYVGDTHTVVCVTKSLYSTTGQTNPSGYLDQTIDGLRLIEVGSNSNAGQQFENRGQGFSVLRELNRTDDWMLIEDRKTHKDFLAGLGDDYEIQAKQSLATNLEGSPILFYRYAGYVYFYALDQLMMFEDDGTNLTAVFQQTIPQIEVPRTGGYKGTMKVPAWTYFAADPR